MQRNSHCVVRIGLALSALILLAACGGSDEAPTVASTVTTEGGETIGVAEFMTSVIEPPSDILWASAGWINDRVTGYTELYPTTDEGWEYVATKSALIIEAGNKLAELAMANDGGAWTAYSEGLSNAGSVALKAAEAHNEEDFFQAGALLYSVCTACHQAYNPDISRFASDEDP